MVSALFKIPKTDLLIPEMEWYTPTSKMSYFTNEFLDELRAKNQAKRAEHWARVHSEIIDQEMFNLKNILTALKTEVLKGLQENVVGVKTTYAVIKRIKSFNFSYVKSDIFDTTHVDIAADKYMFSFRDHIATHEHISLYLIWKSKSFLEKLRKAVDLPENAYFEIKSILVTEEDELLFPGEKVNEYDTELRLVYRFAK